MSELLLPFAKRIADANLVSPDEVLRGSACGCLCPGCNSPVIARQGTEREWHFAHAKGGHCQEGYEVSVHEIAKQMIRLRRELLLPALDVEARTVDSFGLPICEQIRVLDASTVSLDECWTSQVRDDVTVDVAGRFGDQEILVEITVFHRLMPDKRDRLVATGVPSIQIELAEFKVLQATRAKIEYALFENVSNRRWLHHPRMKQARQEAQAKLDARVEQRRAEWKISEEIRLEYRLNCQRELADIQFTHSTHIDRSGAFADRIEPPRVSEAMWRASFPLRENILRASQSLSERTGKEVDAIRAVIDTIMRRGQLAEKTPSQLVNEWAGQLNLPEKEISRFLTEAGYTLF